MYTMTFAIFLSYYKYLHHLTSKHEFYLNYQIKVGFYIMITMVVHN